MKEAIPIAQPLTPIPFSWHLDKHTGWNPGFSQPFFAISCLKAITDLLTADLDLVQIPQVHNISVPRLFVVALPTEPRFISIEFSH